MNVFLNVIHFCDQNVIFSNISPIFSVKKFSAKIHKNTWSFRNHINMLKKVNESYLCYIFGSDIAADYGLTSVAK